MKIILSPRSARFSQATSSYSVNKLAAGSCSNRMSDEERKELEEQLKVVNEKLEERKILIADTSNLSSAAYNALTREQKENCAFSLTIPNEFYLLWEKKILLQKRLGNDVSTLTDMTNDSIKDQLHIKAFGVEERLQRKSMR